MQLHLLRCIAISSVLYPDAWIHISNPHRREACNWSQLPALLLHLGCTTPPWCPGPGAMEVDGGSLLHPFMATARPNRWDASQGSGRPLPGCGMRCDASDCAS